MRVSGKRVKQATIAVVVLSAGFAFVPVLTLVYMACGLYDVLRNDRRDFFVFQRYFSGNGFTTWLASPFNVFIDLISYRNRKIWTLDELGAEPKAEIEEILGYFRDTKADVLARIDRDLDGAKRGMMIYRWFGRRYNTEAEPLNRDFRHVRTIAVSVFDGKESTNFHFGPHRATLRVLYNLTPVPDAEVFIEVGNTKHYWRDDPLFVFDDTLIHRSVNEHDGRRYVVFLDVLRPSPVPAVIRGIEAIGAPIALAAKEIYYRRWKLLGT